MQKRLIINSRLLEVTVDRLCQQLIENHSDFKETVILGMQPRGVLLARLIQKRIKHLVDFNLPVGFLDTTFHRDDFRRRDIPKKANTTNVDFIIEGKRVVLVDDVLYTGRSVRAAMDAMLAFGRPTKVELLILVNRKYSRDLPIEPDYIGRNVNTIASQKVLVDWKEQGAAKDCVWLVDME